MNFDNSLWALSDSQLDSIILIVHGFTAYIIAVLETKVKEVSVSFILIFIVKGFILMEHNYISPQDFRRELIYNSILYHL